MTSNYFDLQVNGYAGVDFNDDAITLEQCRRACDRMVADGAAGCLATVITASIEQMSARLRRLVAFCQQDDVVRSVVLGLHVEGPFISPITGYVGAHPPEHVQPADVGKMQQLLDAGGGLVKLVTLAPEHDANFAVTKLLAEQGIVVSAGHTNADLATLTASVDAGVTAFTHLGNGCPPVLPRHDNIVQRALSLADRLWLMFIADGAHVPFFALKNYLRITGLDRAIVVTDAMGAAGNGPGSYRIGNAYAVVGDDGVPRSPQNFNQLAGSALTMTRAAHNLQAELGLSTSEINRLLTENPRRLLGA